MKQYSLFCRPFFRSTLAFLLAFVGHAAARDLATPTPAVCAWTAAPVIPIPILDEPVTAVGGNMYTFSGVSNGPIVATSYKFDGTTWTTIAPLPVGLNFAAAVNDGTNIYITGGRDINHVCQTTLYRYNVAADTYTTLAPFTVATLAHAAVYLNGKIYKFAGEDDNGLSTDVLEIYDIASNTWSFGVSYPLGLSFLGGAFAQGNFIYAAGGLDLASGTASAKTYRYDPATNTWDDAAIADLPATRWGAASAFYNGGGVLAGGYVNGSATGNISTSVISWDLASNSWSTLPIMLGGRANMNGAVLSGSFYVVGGRSIVSSGFVGTNDNQKLTCSTGPTPTPIPTPSATPTTLGNISTRLRVETGDNVLIGGFIITSTQPKKVLIRAIGPSLSSFVPAALADPVLELRDSSGGLIRSNDNWRSDQEAEIIATTIPPSNDLESAIVATLPANSSAYTAIVRGVNNGTGIALVEVYDLDRTVDSKLANISTRGFVQTGDGVLIGGLIVQGQNPLRVIVRAMGPSLPVAGALGDPTLELHDGNGALIASNDNWRSDQEAEIIATTIPPANDLESAIVRNLAPGNYTAIVRGVNNPTGVALVEAYGLN